MNFDFFMGSHLGLVEVYSFEWSSVRGSLQMGLSAAASSLRSFQLAYSRLLRIRCTMQVCSVVAGNTASSASAIPF